MILGCLIREISSFRLRDCHPLWSAVPKPVRLERDLLTLQPGGSRITSGPTTRQRQHLPIITPLPFRLIPFRSPLLGESSLLSFPGGSEMFQFPPCRLLTLFDSDQDAIGLLWQVSPFGHPRIKACLRLPEDYRS